MVPGGDVPGIGQEVGQMRCCTVECEFTIKGCLSFALHQLFHQSTIVHVHTMCTIVLNAQSPQCIEHPDSYGCHGGHVLVQNLTCNNGHGDLIAWQMCNVYTV